MSILTTASAARWGIVGWLLFALTSAGWGAPTGVRSIPIMNGEFRQSLSTSGHTGWHMPRALQAAGYSVHIDTADTANSTAGGASGPAPCLVLTGTPSPSNARAFGTITQLINAAPLRGHRIRLRAEVWARPGTLASTAFLWLRVDRQGGRPGFFDNMDNRPIAEDTWQAYEIDGEVAPDAEHILFGMGLAGAGTARLRHVTLDDLGPMNMQQANQHPIASLQGPGILHIAMQAAVRAIGTQKTGTVTLPIPGTYRDQVPLDFHIAAKPAAALGSVQFVRRADKINWVCIATVTPPAKGVLLHWTADVLVWERPVATLPRAALPQAPPDAAPWLRATACVQSTDPGIVAQAETLAKGGPDVEEYVRRVVAFTSANRGTGAKFDSLDAAKGLACGGSCTNRANLAAALLRARGIPARTVSHMPAWSAGQPLYEHWLTEYWHPGVGWVWIEPTLGQMQPSPTEAVVLSISSPADEMRAFDPVHLRYIMPGAAYLSVCELSPELTAADLLNTDAINTVHAAARIGGTAAQMASLKAAAQSAWARRMSAGGAGNPTQAAALMAAARTGRASLLTPAIAAKP